jgi:phosphoglycolate phosphatase-like HAD superfamily hydrolase
MPLYLSSATPRTELMAILEARQLTPFFAEVFGDPPQPKADAIQAVLAREGVAPQELLSVGDAASDLRVATEAGVPFIGRESGLFNGASCERHADLFGVAQAVRVRCQS